VLDQRLPVIYRRPHHDVVALALALRKRAVDAAGAKKEEVRIHSALEA
jgi:hypothetical protein